MNWQPGQIAFLGRRGDEWTARSGRLVTIARVTKSGRAVVAFGDAEVTFTPAGSVYGEADRRYVDPWSRLTPVQEGDDVLDAAWEQKRAIEKQRAACRNRTWLIDRNSDKINTLPADKLADLDAALATAWAILSESK